MKMKNLIALAVLGLVFGFAGILEVSAQTQAKDLYTQYNDGNNATVGYEGMKVSVLLKRGNQRERVVSTNETFYSGDKIKLIFDINFSGYAAIVNTGSSGKENLLFPYFDNSNRLISHQVSPNAGTQLPRGNDWIVFDNNAGNERITVIFSKKPIVELENYEETVTGNSSGTQAEGNERDQILSELNSKSLGKSKDLYTQTNNDGTYGVALNGLGNEPVAFTFSLKHK